MLVVFDRVCEECHVGPAVIFINVLIPSNPESPDVDAGSDLVLHECGLDRLADPLDATRFTR